MDNFGEDRRVEGPYKYQRTRHQLGEYPRPPQAGFQPNQKLSFQGWGLSTGDYWNEVFSNYLKRKKGNLTNLGGK